MQNSSLTGSRQRLPLLLPFHRATKHSKHSKKTTHRCGCPTDADDGADDDAFPDSTVLAVLASISRLFFCPLAFVFVLSSRADWLEFVRPLAERGRKRQKEKERGRRGSKRQQEEQEQQEQVSVSTMKTMRTMQPAVVPTRMVYLWNLTRPPHLHGGSCPFLNGTWKMEEEERKKKEEKERRNRW